MILRCIVIDDELLARQYVVDYIHKLPYLDLVGDYNSPLKAIDLIKSGKIDLMYLDIQMPEMSGLDFIRTLVNPPYVIITSAFKEFAIDGYELNVCDYLLKPFSFERFVSATNKVLALKETSFHDSKPQSNLQSETTLHDDYLVIRADRKHYKINYDDLVYVEGQKAYVTFHTINKRITALVSLKELEEKLPSINFIRIHKSYIVSIKKIDTLEGNLIEIVGTKLPVGKNYRKDIANLFDLDG